MVNINIKIQKKDLWLLSAICVFLVGVGFVIGFGDYVNGVPTIMGHSSDEVMVLNGSGEAVGLQEFIDAGGFGSCHSVQASTISTINIDVSCDYGVRTGGGCFLEGLDGDPQGWSRWRKSIPLEPNGWSCSNEDGVGYNNYTAYVVCCE